MLKQSLKFFQYAIKTSGEDDITVYSAYASFFVVISAIPLLMMVFLIIARFVNVNPDDIISLFGSNFPKSTIGLLRHVIDEILSNQAVSLLSFPAITLLWTASRCVVAIQRGLDRVYKVRVKRGFFVLNFNGLIYTFLMLVILLVSLVLIVFGSIFAEVLGDIFPYAIGIIDMIFSLRALISVVVLTLFFAIIYTFLPASKMKMKHQFPGAIFASCGWIVFSFLFSVYVDNFSTQSYLYGSLAAIIILMFWIYFCMIILFIGGELNYFLSKNRAFQAKR